MSAGLLSALVWLLFIAALVGLIWWLYREPPHVTLHREMRGSGMVGLSQPLTVTAEIDTRLPTRVVLEDPPPRAVVPGRPVVFGGLWQGHGTEQLTLNLQPNRRGVYEWEGGMLRWADPLGLFWRSRPLEVPARLEAYPQTHGVLLPDLLRPLLSEGQMTRNLGLSDPISLRGARTYVPGDAPGQIHWRLSARSMSIPGGSAGLPMIRELEHTAASSVTIYLDAGGDATYLESAVRLAASLAAQAWADGLPVSLGTSQGETPLGRTPEAQRAVLRALAELGRSEEGESPQLRPPRQGTNLLVLTQFAPPELVAQAMRARATASRVAIIALPEGFYLEPGEKPRKQWAGAPDTVRQLEKQAGVLAERGVLVFVLRGNQSVLRLG
ncbi:DUF58 domain-containing protein [Deinococcus radiophilus]|uniref:DUF58 domain-containing protein n=2 Tax=Deinococcus radiophilus TaxID=32062 RepID=A0A3S0RKX5_9DEIO|nr:DUF58 domain-containing protein [Deinococcus radiophilus]RTR30952.1 DUF58 domain-containing protein [Deinococcus radiophilus]UFA49538.1 DUF58 domain-containing protein [Deinococcus radiophilus]